MTAPFGAVSLSMKTNSLFIRVVLCWMLVILPAANSAAQDDTEFVPPDDGYDWLRLVSGEWLRGELIGAFGDKVEFDSDVLEELVIDAEDVDQFFSKRIFGVSVRDRDDVVIGRVEVDGKTITVRSGEETLVYPLEDVAAITASATRERDRWSGDLSLGFNARSGNTEFIEYNMSAGIERRTARSRTTIDYLGNFNETEEVQVANNHRVSASVDRFTGSRLFWRPLIAQYFRDPFQNIEHQGTLVTGLGYEMMDSSRTEWDFFAAVGFNYVERVSVEEGQPTNSTSPSLSVGTEFETELTSWMDFEFSFSASFLDEESGTYQHHLESTLSSDLSGNFDIDVSFVWDRTEDPPALEDATIPEQDDFRLLISLAYDF